MGCDKMELSGAKAEVQEVSGSELALPAVPAFEEPKPNPDGTHTVREMRLKGGVYLRSEVKVRGHILWVYDCASAIRTPEMTEKQLKKILTEEPERCDRPNFVLGDASGDTVDKGIQVVDVPRALRKDEKKILPPEDIKAREEQFKTMPAFKQGDVVVVTGPWAQTSPGGFTNTRGLLVYGAMENTAATP